MSALVEAKVEQLVDAGGRPEASFHRASLPYVSGTVLRGALAQRWITENGLPTDSETNRDEFTALFHGDLAWGQLTQRGAAPEPLSLLKHKYRTDCAAPALDRAYGDTDVSRFPTRCAECGGWLEPGKGRWSVPPGSVASRTRAGLADSGGRREVARDGQLFTREGIKPGIELVGTVSGEHAWLDRLVAGQERVSVRLGGQRSVNGRCDVTMSAQNAPLAPPVPNDDPKLVVLRATSPCVFVDEAGRARLEPRVAELGELTGSAATVVGRWARPVTIGGWDLVSGLPKPDEVAVIAGSTWLVRFNDPVSDSALARLSGGLGLRRCEGYGQVDVNPATTEPRVRAEAEIPEVKSELRILAADVRRAFAGPGGDLDWAAGLLLDLATELTIVGEEGGVESEVVDRAMHRARVARLAPGELTALKHVAREAPEVVRNVSVLVKAGL